MVEQGAVGTQERLLQRPDCREEKHLSKARLTRVSSRPAWDPVCGLRFEPSVAYGCRRR